MGKSQKKRAVRRHNPVRVPDSHLPHGLASASSTSTKNEAIIPIIQKLGSVEASERVWACAAVSNLIQNDPSTRRLLQGKNIIGTLITRLSDGVEEVLVEAGGALRNLCIDGGYDICAEMYNKNILAPLRTFPAKISAALQQFLNDPTSAPENSRRLVYDFAESVITIFWCLSETSNKALKAVNETNLIPFLVAFLQARDSLPLSTVNAAAQCLYVLTEENDPAIDCLRTESSYVSTLLEIAKNEHHSFSASEDGNKTIRWITLRVLASGILRNIAPLPAIMPVLIADLENTVILPLLVPQLSLDLADVTTTVTQLLSSVPDQYVISTNPSLSHAPRSDHKTSAEKELDYIEEKLRATQLTLEILTGVCAKLPEPGIPPEEEIPDDADVDDEMEMEMDLQDESLKIEDIPLPATNDVGSLRDHEQHSNHKRLSALIEPLIRLVHPTALSFPPSTLEPSPHPPTTSALSTIHVRALECLNNLFLTVEEPQRDGGSGAFSIKDRECLKSLWNELWRALGKVGKVVKDGKIINPRSLEKKAEVWDIAVGVLWGIGRVVRGQLVPDAEQVQVLMELCDVVTDDMTKVKCIGALECLAQNVDAIDANKVISTYLLTQVTSGSATYPESCLQAASALIDIFSDETFPYDINFRQGQMVDVLARALPAIRKQVRSIDRRKAGGMELRARGDDVVTNLVAFIKYRRALNLP